MVGRKNSPTVLLKLVTSGECNHPSPCIDYCFFSLVWEMKLLVYCNSNTWRATYKAPSCALSTTHHEMGKNITKKKNPVERFGCQWTHRGQCRNTLERKECCVSGFQPWAGWGSGGAHLTCEQSHMLSLRQGQQNKALQINTYFCCKKSGKGNFIFTNA